MMSKKIAERVPPGHHIYAYCNVRTNQVLYSMQPTLKHAHLKQLPDIGANYTPPKLRKDSWRPLWSLSLPSTRHGQLQGLDAFKKLREYRKLHETCWEPPSQLNRPYTEKEIEKLQEKLDNRGGSKKESVYDIIKRQKHKMRVHEIMDQKANSIADLAAVLVEQEDLGSKALQLRLPREKEVKEMISLAAEAENGQVNVLLKKSENLKKEPAQIAGGQGHRLKMKKFELSRAREKMLFAQKAVAHVRKFLALPLDARLREENYWKRLVDDRAALQAFRVTLKDLNSQLAQARVKPGQMLEVEAPIGKRMRDDTISTQQAKIEQLQTDISQLKKENEHRLFADQQSEDLQTSTQIAVAARLFGLEIRATQQRLADVTPPQEAIENGTQAENQTILTQEDYEKYLPSFPGLWDPMWRIKPKSNWFKKETKLEQKPIFTTRGVTVHWENILDAEFASIWPQDVEHVPMGAFRHSHRGPPPPRVISLRKEKQQKPPDHVVVDTAQTEAKTKQLTASDVEATSEDRVSPQEKVTRSLFLKQVQDEILNTIRNKANEGEKKKWGWTTNETMRNTPEASMQAVRNGSIDQATSTRADGT